MVPAELPAGLLPNGEDAESDVAAVEQGIPLGRKSSELSSSHGDLRHVHAQRKVDLELGK